MDGDRSPLLKKRKASPGSRTCPFTPRWAWAAGGRNGVAGPHGDFYSPMGRGPREAGDHEEGRCVISPGPRPFLRR